MIHECIILAGGLGTRLRSAVSDLPKVMADIGGRPFLFYILNRLRGQGMTHIVISTGYMSEIIEHYIKKDFHDFRITIAKEDKPLGTGGGVMNALKHCKSEEVIIVNGDTYFAVDLNSFYHQHKNKKALFSIALKPIEDASRYGTVRCDENHVITDFIEKSSAGSGLINGGIYIINKSFFASMNWPGAFSLEKDFLEKYFSTIEIYGFPFDEYFIDIGIPADYERAGREFKELMR